MTDINDGVDCSNDVVRTKQTMKNECDVNRIMARIKKTGVIPDSMYRAGAYGDFTGITDFQDMQLKIKIAETSFMQLPAAVRAKFENDPAKLMEWISNPENRGEAINLGLIPQDPEPEKMPPEPQEPPEEPNP